MAQATTTIQPNNLLKVTVKDPERTAFEGNAKAISSFNTTGPFDILPYHANFISIIKDTVIIHKEDGSQEKIALQEGIVKAHEDTIHILIGIETDEKDTKKENTTT